MVINIVTTIMMIIILVLIAMNAILIFAGNDSGNNSDNLETELSWAHFADGETAANFNETYSYETDISIVSAIQQTEAETETETETQSETETETETGTETERKAQTETEAVTEAAATNSGGVFAFPDSNSRYIDKSELAGMGSQDLVIARNEIYARRGRGFTDSSLQAYFDQQGWYTKLYSPEEFDAIASSLFNQYETGNINTITQYEIEMGYR